MAKLKDIENYTPQEKSHMEEMLGHFNGSMDAYNKWWEAQNDSSINNWKKALDRFKKLEAEKNVPKTIGKKSAAKPDSYKISTSKVKQAQDHSGLNQRKKEEAKRNTGKDLNKPRVQTVSGEKKIQGDTNSYITLGNDRTGGALTGYGGANHSHSANIDIVAGVMGSKARATDHFGNPIVAEKDFATDAARIYISQKMDIDAAFGLDAGGVGNWTARSGIGSKADHIRIIGREGIKLVTQTDAKNSQGGDIDAIGIDIIAGNNDEELQPMVKGKNLKDALERIVHHIDKLNGIVDGMLMAQMQFNAAIASHTHISPFNGIVTTPSITVVSSGTQTMVSHLKDTKLSLMTHKANLQLFKAKYLTIASSCWVLSRYNNSN